MSVEDRGPQLAAVLAVFLSLATLFVFLRLYVKTFITKSWGSDDAFYMIAFTFFAAYCACSATGVHYGTGQHVQNIPPAHIPIALHYWWFCELFYDLSTAFIRVSVAIFLLRICVKPIHKYIVFTVMGVVILFSLYYLLLVIFQCSPYTYFWGQYAGAKGTCINAAWVPDSTIAHSSIGFVADWTLGILPMFLIYDLKMNTRTKLSVMFLLSLGLLAGLATLIRIPYVQVLALTDDFLYATTDVAIWSTIEPALGIIAIGGATLRPLFRSLNNLTKGGSQDRRPSTNAVAGVSWRDSRLNHLVKLQSASTSTQRSNPDPYAFPPTTMTCAGDGMDGEIHQGKHMGTSTSEVETGVRSPFGDSAEFGDRGAINVHHTVDVSSMRRPSDTTSYDPKMDVSYVGGNGHDMV